VRHVGTPDQVNAPNHGDYTREAIAKRRQFGELLLGIITSESHQPLFRRTPDRPPFSSMNSTLAASSVRRMAWSLARVSLVPSP